MTVFLHIGSEKTGSTALQNFLQKHRTSLQEKSILFPETMGDPNNFALALLMKDTLEDRQFMNKWFRYDGIDNPDFEALCIDRLERSDGLRNYENIVLSSEHIFSLSKDRAGVEKLIAFLSQISSDIRIIVYLRPLHQLVISLMSSRMKSGGTPTLSDVIEHTGWLEYDTILENYCALVGRENVLVRKYKSGETIPDFLATIGVDFLPASGKSERKNASLGQAQLDLLRDLNGRIPAFIDGERNTLRNGLPEFVATRSAFDPIYLDQANLDLLRARLGASNDRLMATFIDDPEFMLPQTATIPAEPALERDEILMQLFVNLWTEHKAQVEHQQNTAHTVFSKALRAARKRGRRLIR